MSDDNGKWSLDKRVPIALIITIVIGGTAHTLTFAWAASNLWTRVGELERQQIAASPRLESVIRLETKMDALQAAMTEIKATLAAWTSSQQQRR